MTFRILQNLWISYTRGCPAALEQLVACFSRHLVNIFSYFFIVLLFVVSLFLSHTFYILFSSPWCYLGLLSNVNNIPNSKMYPLAVREHLGWIYLSLWENSIPLPVFNTIFDLWLFFLLVWIHTSPVLITNICNYWVPCQGVEFRFVHLVLYSFFQNGFGYSCSIF